MKAERKTPISKRCPFSLGRARAAWMMRARHGLAAAMVSFSLRRATRSSKLPVQARFLLVRF